MWTYIQELWTYRELIYTLVLRDLKVRYKNSLLGVMWSWLNPLLMMLVFTLVFGFLWSYQSLENTHILFLSALLPWNFFTGAVIGGMSSIINNGHLVKKVYFPREILPITAVLANLINFLMALPVFFLLVFLSGVQITPWILLLPLPIFIEVLFIIGIAFFLSTLEVFYRDTHMIMEVVMQAWFFMTPIMYPREVLQTEVTLLGQTINPQTWLFWLNPMASIINTYQDILYYGTLSTPEFLLRTAATAIIILIAGYAFFRKFSGRFGEVV